MINVNVSIIGVLLKPQGKSNLQVQLDDGATIRRLLTELRYEERYMEFIFPIVNGHHRRLNYILSDGDGIELSVPISGG